MTTTKRPGETATLWPTPPTGRPVPAITLWQPWGTLIADEQKRFETRGWSTQYRGPLLIHAGARSDNQFAGELWLAGQMATDPVDMPKGAVVAVANLTAVHRTTSALLREQLTDDERRVGDFSPGRYAWELENVRRLASPVKCKGALSLWVPDQSVLDAVVAQVGAL